METPTPPLEIAPAPVAPPTPPAITTYSPPVAPAAAPAAAEAPQMSVMSALKSMNWTEVAFGVLGATALYFVIYYYRNSTAANSAFKIEMQNKIDEMAIKIADISSVLNDREGNTNNTGSSFFNI